MPHLDGDGRKCNGKVYLASDGIMRCCPRCGAFFNPGSGVAVGHNLDAAQDHYPAGTRRSTRGLFWRGL